MTAPSVITAPDNCAASVIMTLRRVVGVTASPFTLEEQRFKWPGEQWSIDFRLPPFTTRDVFAEWQAFMLRLEGTFNIFLMGDPSAKTPRGVATGTPQIDGNNQVGNTLLTKGWTNSVTGILKKGDYIQIGTGALSRLHMVVEDANSNGSGVAALSICPALRYSPTNNGAIVVNDAKGAFRLSDNETSWSVDPGPVYRMSFNAIEVMNA